MGGTYDAHRVIYQNGFHITKHRAFVASDPQCKKDCGLDIGCYFSKFDVGCGGSTIPGVSRYQPGVVTPSGHGGEEKNPATGCDSGDVGCNVLTGTQKSILGGFDFLGKGILPYVALGAGAIVLIVILRRH